MMLGGFSRTLGGKDGIRTHETTMLSTGFRVRGALVARGALALRVIGAA